MKNTKVTLVPLTADDREQFILDNQWAFKYGAMMEFYERDDHIDDDGEIISCATIEKSIDNSKSETYRIMLDGEKVGGRYSRLTRKRIITTCIFSLYCPNQLQRYLYRLFLPQMRSRHSRERVQAPLRVRAELTRALT